MSGRLAGKVALVTGAASGIGRGCALMFAREGAHVVGCDIDADGAKETLALAKAEGLTIDVQAPCDLLDEASVAALVEGVVSRHGGLDTVVNVAGHAEFAPLPEMTLRQWRATMTGELDIVFLLTRTAWPFLIARGGGAIVNLASAAAWRALHMLPQIAHAAGKGGVLAMTRQMALEGAPHRIRANSISPGLIVTPATEGAFKVLPDYRAWISERTMLDRLGEPEDVANAAAFLASDQASWITGADLPVDGGLIAW